MLVIEITNTRGRALSTKGRNGTQSFENIIGFAICPESRNPRAKFNLADAPLVCELLENPGAGHEFGGVGFYSDRIEIGGEVFEVTAADRYRLIARIVQVENY